MTRFLLSVFFALLAVEADAQDISIHMDEIGAGSYVIYQENGKEFVTHVFRGKIGSNYVRDIIGGKSPNGERLVRYLSDSSGQTHTTIGPSGSMTTYKPHNCMRTIGKCEYTLLSPDGRSLKMMQVITPRRGGFKFDQYLILKDGSRAVVRSGKLSLDNRGVMRRGVLTTPQGPRLRLVQKHAAFR